MENNFKIDFKSTPHKIYRNSVNSQLFKIANVEGQLWMAKSQMELIFDLSEKKISKILKHSLNKLRLSETEFSTYLKIYRWKRESHHKFYQVRLALHAGDLIKTKGFYDFQNWVNNLSERNIILPNPNQLLLFNPSSP